MAPKEVSTGVEQKTFTVNKVNPFVNWSATVKTQPDEDDYGIVSQYVSHTYTARSVSLYETLAGSRTSGGFTILNSGIEVFLNDATAPSALSGAFSLSSNTVSYTLSESVLSDHKGGLVEIKGYVENMHSMNRIYHAGAEFGIYVHGAIGATLEISGGNKAIIGTDWCGSETSYGFNKISGYRFIKSGYSNGQNLQTSAGDVTVGDVNLSYSAFGETVYSWTRTSGTFTKSMIQQAEQPRFEFLDVTGIGVFVDGDGITTGYYFLQPSGTPSVDGHGYYVLHCLHDIQNKGNLMGAKQGWLN